MSWGASLTIVRLAVKRLVRRPHERLLNVKPMERRAGLRLAYLIKQYLDAGWTIRKLANTIDVDETLLTKWRNVEKVKSGLAERAGLRDTLFQGVVVGLRVSSDFFFVDSVALKRTNPRARVVELSDGTERPAEEGELDAKLFSLEQHRERLDADARDQIALLRQRDSQRDAQIAALTEQVDRLTQVIDRLTRRDVGGMG